ncbi:MAG: SNF2-related protein [Candidatus Aminicenantes bacterium]|nr:SNF2-related protein [Candidatus Aminicenantes bacterium]
MAGINTDLTFFTNEAGQDLLDRFKVTLKDTHLFDVLVGYFRSSGFYQLYRSIADIEKTRILIGLGVDEESYRAIDQFRYQTVIDFESHSNAKKYFQKNLLEEIEESQESDQLLETGIREFTRFLNTDCPDPDGDRKRGGNGKKLEIRAYPSRNIHAKVYIGRFRPGDRDFGFVITGSSNFSYAGLVANREFNVELRQRRDVEFALEQFEDLWKNSVDVSMEFVDTVQKKTWLNDAITPYELYLKAIYEYLQEDINIQDRFEFFLPEGFMKLQYQEQAVFQALRKLEEYNGVFIADVVGLGKTFITAQLLQQVRGRILVICPPVLCDYWQESLMKFQVPSRVESLGKLEQVIRKGAEQYDYVVVDEAHRFRNEATQSYAALLDICRGKKVILVTATPLNNKIEDIFTQLKLFQAPKNSTIPGVPNLEKFFNRLKKRFTSLDKSGQEYRRTITGVSKEIRENILKHIMVRRTRSDVTHYFKNDIETQGLVFPEMQDPQKIVYSFTGKVETVFNQTIRLFQDFRYARYIPLLYYTGRARLSEFEKQQQRNVGGFMKSILVKRLESSFYAFKKSVGRFVDSYERFMRMFEGGAVYIGKKVNVYDLLDNDDWEKLEKYVEEEKVQEYDAGDFHPDFPIDLRHDLEILKQVRDLWRDIDEDPKLHQLIHELRENRDLKKKKLVIFSESKETGDYLYEKLSVEFPGEIMAYSSRGGRRQGTTAPVKHGPAREIIKSNFDPNEKENADDIRILITTDMLAEGINLHRANILVNYDLPWNPTRVLQRAGRINRLGTQHPKIYIFNFFPTSQADSHLGLEINIKNKIQMFHDILGEDARYLSDGEEIGSQELFDTLNNKKAYTGEDEEGDSELQYLEMIRNIRDEQPDLFEKIKLLPKKARSGFRAEEIETDQLVTFFRLGKLKKFYRHDNDNPQEITFFDAVNQLQCRPETPRQPVPGNYYRLLEDNKEAFRRDTSQDIEIDRGSGGRSNLDYIERRLKDKYFKNCRKFTDSDEEFLENLRKMMAQGTIAKKVAREIKKELENTLDPLEILNILRKHIRGAVVSDNQPARTNLKREVILSGYLLKK